MPHIAASPKRGHINEVGSIICKALTLKIDKLELNNIIAYYTAINDFATAMKPLLDKYELRDEITS